MNKKLLLGAALLVGIGTTLTSCVDSFESASVTNVREAKAEQLKSIADFNKAQAQAALIVANAQQAAQAANEAYQQAQAAYLAAQAEAERAEADLKKAQAAYWNAQAAYLNAQTDAEKAKLQAQLDILAAQLQDLQIKNEKAQAELEMTRDQAAYNKAYLANEIEKLKIDLEKAQVLLEQEKVRLDQDIRQYQKDMKADQRAEVEYYALKYKNASKQYFAAKKDLAQEQANLITLKAGLENVETTLAKKIANKKNKLNENKAALAADQDLLAFYQKYAGQKVTAEMLAEAIDNLNAAKTELDKADEALEGAKKAFEEATAALDDSQLKTLIKETIRPNSNPDSWDLEDDRNYNGQTFSYTEPSDEYDREGNQKFNYYSCQIVYIPRASEDSSNSQAVPTDCRGKWVVKTGKGLSDNRYGYDNIENLVYTYTPIYDVPQESVASVTEEKWDWHAINNQVSLSFEIPLWDEYGNWKGYKNYNVNVYPPSNIDVDINSNVYDDDWNLTYESENASGYLYSIQQWSKELEAMDLAYIVRKFYTPIEAGLKVWKDWREAYIKAWPADVEGLKKDITTAKEFVASAKDIYDTYVSKDDAYKAWQDALTAQAALDPDKATDAEKKDAQTAVDDAQKEYDGIVADIAKPDFTKQVDDLLEYLRKHYYWYLINDTNDAESVLHITNNLLNSANEALATAEFNADNKNFTVEKVEELVKNINKAAIDSENLVKAVNSAAESQVIAETAREVAYNAWDENDKAVTSLENSYDSYIPGVGNQIFNELLSGIQQDITTTEGTIKKLETKIPELEDQLKNIQQTATNDYGELFQVVIAKQEAEIQECTDLVNMWETLYNAAKAALEAALGGSESETPAE